MNIEKGNDPIKDLSRYFGERGEIGDSLRTINIVKTSDKKLPKIEYHKLQIEVSDGKLGQKIIVIGISNQRYIFDTGIHSRFATKKIVEDADGGIKVGPISDNSDIDLLENIISNSDEIKRHYVQSDLSNILNLLRINRYYNQI